MTVTDEAEVVLVVRRTMPLPRALIFEAWLDPESLADFMRPNAFGRASVEVEPRVGGRFRIVMHEKTGRNYEHRGEYLAIDPPSSLSFTWISEATGQPTVVTLDFLEKKGGTEVVLTHRLLRASQIENHRDGWSQILQLLEAELVT